MLLCKIMILRVFINMHRSHNDEITVDINLVKALLGLMHHKRHLP